MAKKSITTITTQLHDLLKPLDPQERIRAIKAALMLLGDNESELAGDSGGSGDEENKGKGGTKRGGKAGQWAKSNGITGEHLGQVFDGTEVIASAAPGKNAREQTINAYVLTGIAALLEKGEATFDDNIARAVCKHLGCLNEMNHAKYLKTKGNVLSGSKGSGWRLTAPGMKKGADLVKEIAQA
jgi:hypothetical protein